LCTCCISLDLSQNLVSFPYSQNSHISFF
jgi:hypothetical protein